MLEQIQPFIIALFIGLLIGIERERSHPEGVQTSGVRTFILLALLGCLAAYLHQPSLDIVLSLFVFGLIIAGYFRSTAKNRSKLGLTTEFSAGAVYCLGYITFSQAFLASALGAFILLVLITRKTLHTFSRDQLKPQELQAMSTLLVIALGILPFLPNQVIDPWHLFNPRLFGVLFLAVAVLQFGGYIAIRLAGQRLGLMLTGFFGGLVSSTVVFVQLPKTVHDKPELYRSAIASSLFAVIASFVQFLIIIALSSEPLFKTFCWPVMAMIGTGIFISLFLIRESSPELSLSETLNPLDLKSVAKLSLILAGMVFLVGFTEQYLGLQAFDILTFLGGLFDLRSVTFATANLFAHQHVIIQKAGTALALAILASILSKIAILCVMGRDRFALLTSLFLIIMGLVGAGVYLIV